MFRSSLAVLALVAGVGIAQAQPARAPACSINSVPPSETQRIKAEYQRRVRTDGEASAGQWASAQLQRVYAGLVARGVCPGASTPARGTAGRTAPPRTAKAPVSRGRRGGDNCHMETRLTPNFNGYAPTQTMVTVCN